MNKRILLIEDEEFLREIYKRTLEQEGLVVDAFATGKEGMVAFKRSKYDLVILDIMLPDTNGLEMLRQMKTVSGKQSIPVIFLSNLGQESVIEEGKKLGAKGYLVKSTLNPDQVVAQVKNFLEESAS